MYGLGGLHPGTMRLRFYLLVPGYSPSGKNSGDYKVHAHMFVLLHCVRGQRHARCMLSGFSCCIVSEVKDMGSDRPSYFFILEICSARQAGPMLAFHFHCRAPCQHVAIAVETVVAGKPKTAFLSRAPARMHLREPYVPHARCKVHVMVAFYGSDILLAPVSP